ncbi:MAG: ParB/RepB/Spo0J family partition protein, partial [Planctomycetota bacterium]
GSRIDERAVRRNRCSIARFGLLNPLVVRRVEDRYQLLHGYARYEGCKRLGLGEVPVLVKEVEEMEAVELALLDILLENSANHVEPDSVRALLRFYTGLWRDTTSRGCTQAQGT